MLLEFCGEILVFPGRIWVILLFLGFLLFLLPLGGVCPEII
jgi:hypothetical protein